MENHNFVHLHVHNEYSLLDGFGSAEAYCERAKEMGFQHLALTNHGNVDGCIKFQRAADKVGIHSILGAEAYIVEDMSIKAKGDNRFHITLLAKNDIGWKNLLQLSTYANVQGFYRRPRIDPNLLLDYVDGLVVMTACCSGFIKMPGGKELLYELDAKTDVFMEIMPVYVKPQSEMNRLVLDIHKESGIPIVATMDCHYPLRKHNELQEVLLAIQTKKKWNDPKRWKFDIDDLYLKSVDEMIESFDKLGGVPRNKVVEAMENTMVVADLCTLHVDPIPVVLPKVDVLQYRGLDEKEQLTRLILDGLDRKAVKHEWIGQNIDKYYERVEEELGLIFELGFERYFLIVWELIGWCKENDVFTGPGRGSVGGCLCAFLLRITSVDSLYWDLPFSRFISPARIDLPDIDMDFEDIKRDKIRKHLEDLYGKFNVTSLSTFARLNGRSAIRDISRVFDVPYKDVDAAAKSIVVRSLGDFRAAYTIEDAFSAFEDGIKFKRKYPRVSRIAIAMEGQIKSAGKHAAAMCVAENDLRSGENISLSIRQGEPICSFDKYDAEHLGLMKLDVLGLNALTVLHAAKKLIKKRYNIDIDYEEILFDDEKVLGEFTKGNTAGVFQFASHSMIKLCREIHTEDFEQVISLNALNRPGCLRSGMSTDYKERKHGEKKIPKMHPIMAKITKNTFGIVLFQEQIMYIMYDLAGLPWKTADMVRKVISKSTGEEQFMKFKQLFIDGCKEKDTLSPKEAKSIFEELKHFGSYGFNRAHSVEYAMIAYWDMWLKVKYPVEFIVSLLSFGPEGEKKLEHVAEAKRLGLKLFLPDINKSKSKQWEADEKGNLLIPFCEIKGIGPVAGDTIVKYRGNELFKNKDDFISRVPKRQVSSRVVTLLEKVGAFDSSATLELPEEKLDELSDLFDFDLSNDPMYRYKRMLKVIELGIKLSKLVDVTTKKDPTKKLYFGRMLNVKFGYKEKVKNSKTGADTSKGLGGVYGNFNDGTDFAMLTFNSDLYESRKNEIEHCAGQWLMARGSSPFKTDSVFADGAWFGDDLLKGEAKGLGLELAKEAQHTDDFAHMFNGLSQCNGCDLRGECRAPVLPSLGQMNMMIVGEGPGPTEDRQGEGFIGDAGNLLFGKPKVKSVVTLEQRGIPRLLCHITNVVKCYPKITRTPKAVHIRECSKWLEEEIKIVRPFVILSFGNTGMKFFKEMDSGIMNLNGTTEWSNKFNCWVCYSVHPASVLYESSNASLLNNAFSNFVEKIGTLGFGL